MISVQVTSRQQCLRVDPGRIAAAVRTALEGEGEESAEVSVAVVDDAAIQELNRRYLDHDFPTDVLSFALGDDEGPLEGEIVMSAETAARAAPRYGWSAEEELLLYAVHGALHLAGLDDQSPSDRARMRRRERASLERLGLAPPARTRRPGETPRRSHGPPSRRGRGSP